MRIKNINAYRHFRRTHMGNSSSSTVKSDVGSYIISGCTGRHIVRFGKWYSPSGKEWSPLVACEWCVHNGCVNMDYSNKIQRKDGTFYAKCCCPYVRDHITRGKVITSHICEDCKDLLVTRDTTSCRKCGQSSDYNYCDGCSAIFNRCQLCEKNINKSEINKE